MKIESRKSLHTLRTKLPGLTAQLTFWSTVAIGTALDLWSKSAVFNFLQQSRHAEDSISIIDGLLQLVVAENAGAAFGIAAGKTQLLVTLSAVALIAVFAIFLFSRTGQKLLYIALGLFAAGVCGNLYDRVFNDGLVRDFIDLYYRQYHWPVFNIADTMLCIAVGLLLISTLFTGKSSRRCAQRHK